MIRLFYFFMLLSSIFIISCKSAYSIDYLKEKYAKDGSDFVSIQGMDVHYKKTGSGSPIILMHGVASSLHTWDYWQKELSKKYTVYSIDLPSFGLTGSNPKKDYSKEFYMGFIDEFISKNNITDSLVMGGNSFGGLLSWNYAIHNKKVKKLILVDAAGYPPTLHKIPLSFVVVGAPIISGFSHLTTPKFLVKSSVKNVYGDDSKITPEIEDRYYELLLREGNRTSFPKVLKKVFFSNNYDKEDIKKVTVPTLILWGEKDRIFKHENADSFAEDISGKTTVVKFPTAAHIPMEEIPEETLIPVLKFLEEK